MDRYDVIVIGAGPAGYVAAIRAAQLEQKVAIIEKEYIGGVCLNVGCIPTKSLLKNADVAHLLRERGVEFGFSFENLKLDYRTAVKRSREISNGLSKDVDFLLRKNKIDVFRGTATLSSDKTLQITSEEGSIDLQGSNIVIATGASPFILPGVDVDGKRVLTYKEAIFQDFLPKSVVIIGGGAIGMEFATIWSSYGVDITIVEMLDRILPNEDEEVSIELHEAYKKPGITIITSGKVTAVDNTNSKAIAHVETSDGVEKIEAEQILLAASFVPNSQGLGLDKVGVKTTEHGFIMIDERMATNVPGIWAIGDVTGKLMLAHAGMAMGEVCAENIVGVETVTLNYQNMPRATYTRPQVASFGMTESQAKNDGYEVKIGRCDFEANGKALGMGDHVGWAKLVVDARYGEILGAHLVGPEVTELLPELTLAQSMELTPAEIARNIHAHPTLCEVLGEAAKAAEDRAIHA